MIDIDKVAEERMEAIQLQKVLLKPKQLRTFNKELQSRVSKAFVKSILSARFPPNDFLSKMLIDFDARHKQSLMFLPLIKPF